MAEQWLSIVEYARTYQVSDMTVRRRIKTGKLHAVLKEGKYFIPVAGSESRGMPVETDHRHDRAEIQVIKAHPAAHRTLSAMVAPKPQQQRPIPNQTHNHVIPPPPVAAQDHHHYDDGNHVSNYQPSNEGMNQSHQVNQGVIPSSLRRPLATQETSLVDTRALLAFCEASMRKVNELERRQVERFKGKLEALEATLERKDFEIQTLRQQVEDLQLLASTLEKRLTERRG